VVCLGLGVCAACAVHCGQPVAEISHKNQLIYLTNILQLNCTVSCTVLKIVHKLHNSLERLCCSVLCFIIRALYCVTLAFGRCLNKDYTSFLHVLSAAQKSFTPENKVCLK